MPFDEGKHIQQLVEIHQNLNGLNKYLKNLNINNIVKIDEESGIYNYHQRHNK